MTEAVFLYICMDKKRMKPSSSLSINEHDITAWNYQSLKTFTEALNQVMTDESNTVIFEAKEDAIPTLNYTCYKISLKSNLVWWCH